MIKFVYFNTGSGKIFNNASGEFKSDIVSFCTWNKGICRRASYRIICTPRAAFWQTNGESAPLKREHKQEIEIHRRQETMNTSGMARRGISE